MTNSAPTGGMMRDMQTLIEESKESRKNHNMDAATYNYNGDEEVPQRLQLSPIFNAIWDEIKEWDVNVPYAYNGYSGATGTHVMAILKALSNAGVIDIEQIKADAVSDPRKKMLR